MMKGIAVGIFVAAIAIPVIILMITVLLFGTTFTSVYAFDCRQDTIDQVSGWIEKMKLSTAQGFDAEFRVGSCVEYISEEENGIKFKDDDRVTQFTMGENFQDRKVVFEIQDVGTAERTKILASTDSYVVRIVPSETKIIIGGRVQ